MAGARHRSRARGRRAPVLRLRTRRRPAAQGLQPNRAGAQHRSDPERPKGSHHDDTERSPGGHICPSSTRTSATGASTSCSATMPSVWESMRLDLDDESVVVVPSISLAIDVGAAAPSMQAMEERALFLLLLLRQPRLRMIYVTSHADRGVGRRVLPRPAAGRDPQPCASAADAGLGRRRVGAAAERQAAGPAASAAADPIPGAQPEHAAT